MIESLYLRQFQNHRKLRVKFDPFVTVIYGPTGSGKSSAIRAIKWITLNRPDGESFIGNWRKAKSAYGRLKIDGQTVARRRGSGHNKYYLGSRVYSAPGRKRVPSRIADLVNLGPNNFQSQIEAPFWFTLRASELSRRLNEILNLRAIDKSLQLAAQEVRKTKSEAAVSRDRLGAAQKQCTDLQWIVGFSSQVNKLKRLNSDMAVIASESLRIDSAIRGVSRAALDHQNAGAAASASAIAIRAAVEYRAMEQKAVRLGSLVAQIERSRRLAAQTPPSIAPVRRSYNAALDAANDGRKLHGLWLAASNLRWERRDLEKKIEDVQKQLKKFRGRCPTCGAKLKRGKNHGKANCSSVR